MEDWLLDQEAIAATPTFTPWCVLSPAYKVNQQLFTPLFGQGPALFFPAGPTGNGARVAVGGREGQSYGSGVVAHTWSCTASP